MNPKEPIILVSGLPRSGTSMMMKMLEEGGIEILTDNLRTADANNPNGYYEFEPVKQLKNGNMDWLSQATGKAVKIIATLITHLPANYDYKVIFMQRNIQEVLASQKKMLGRLGKQENGIPDDKMAKIFMEHVKTVESWLSKQRNMEILYVNYNEMVVDPYTALGQINQLLGGNLDEPAMADVVNRDLYREREPETAS